MCQGSLIPGAPDTDRPQFLMTLDFELPTLVWLTFLGAPNSPGKQVLAWPQPAHLFVTAASRVLAGA